MKKIGQPQNGSPICQSQVWLPTDLDINLQLIITVVTISEHNKYI